MWVDTFPPNKEQLLQFAETYQGTWLSGESVDRILYLWEVRPSLVATLDRLPTSLCHNDSFRRNLMLRQTENGNTETVAIDWAFTGLGKVGQETAVTTAVALHFMEVAIEQAKELDEVVFAGYCDGLRDAGWQGDLRLVRFGYTVTAALDEGMAQTALLSYVWQRPGGTDIGQAIVGRPLDAIVEQFRGRLPFLLDLGDEALALLPSIEQIMA
jgi:Phosphotransferase enzyme family